MDAVEDVERGEGAAGLGVETNAAPGARPATSRRRRHPDRLPLMALAMVALLGAIWAGLLRLGWLLPSISASLAASHGALMVSGFLGTVIGIERAAALGRPWAYAAPLATGLGALALIAGPSGPIGPLLMTAGSALAVGVFCVILSRQWALFTVVMTLGTGLWLAGHLLWLAGWPLHRVVYWWAGFLTFTIAGERLELARLVHRSPLSSAVFLVALAVFGSGLALTLFFPDPGVRLVGFAGVALAVWLGRQDIARRTVRQTGLTRFIALCLLAGYGWLGVGGLLAARFGGVAAGPAYDAILHALFVGFVFSMIFGHAPIILPAVVGWPVAYRPVFYAPLALLHLGLIVRVAGDLLQWLPARQWGGLLNAVVILLFLATMVHGVLKPAAKAPAP